MKKLSPSIKDLFILLIVTTITSMIFIEYDAFEELNEFTRTHEEYELDEIILVVFVLSFATIWYSIRRFLEVKRLKKVIEKKNKELYEENLKKDILLEEQIKMASLGEMIENIAHQWRQPLSLISIAASGLKVKKEYQEVSDKEVEKVLGDIMTSTNYLSETIDIFRSFVKDSGEAYFNLDDNIKTSLNLVKSNLEISNIKLVLDLNTNTEIQSFPNDLIQVFINIINNSKEAFEQSNSTNKYIFIYSYEDENEIIIKISDNAGGISSDIINKIFEPYFTTKHKNSGTGLGLYLVYKIITQRINGKIAVHNIEFEYEKKRYEGTEFTIKLAK